MAHFKYKIAALMAVLSLTALCACTSRAQIQDPPTETSMAAIKDIVPTITPAVSASPEPSFVPETVAPEMTPEPSPDNTYPDVPKQETAVEDDFFSDAAFLGNSLVDGFRLFSGITTPDYYGVTSLTVTNAGAQVDLMDANQYGKVYILLGINEIGYDVEYFIEQYATMLDKIKEHQSNADIYVMAITPVSASKSASSTTFNKDRVKKYNDALYELAKEKECYYLDIYTPLGDADGFLPANRTSDGVHFTAEHYTVWADYLRNHYVD